MKAAYYFIMQTVDDGEAVYQTQISVLADSASNARRKAIEMLGVKSDDAQTTTVKKMKLVMIQDVELLKQRFEQVMDRPEWRGED